MVHYQFPRKTGWNCPPQGTMDTSKRSGRWRWPAANDATTNGLSTDAATNDVATYDAITNDAATSLSTDAAATSYGFVNASRHGLRCSRNAITNDATAAYDVIAAIPSMIKMEEELKRDLPRSL